ncbi:MAG: long-chain fatty acid--CoA ligase, partial [Polyangiaceae bacterium]|nr:long-chain fatty acid--CoA ligase [Polyangiaceae bacterium]
MAADLPFEPRFKTLVQILQTSVSACADRPVFGTKRGDGWAWTTYGEFGRQVDRLRAGLAARGIKAGDRVAMIADNRVEWAVAAYACYGLGAAYVPMYEAQHPKEWEYIVRNCEAKVVFVANDPILAKARPWLDAVPTLKMLVVLDGNEAQSDGRVIPYATLAAGGTSVPAIDPAPGDLASLLYTSGTTGLPKGVMLTHLNLASNVSAFRAIYPFGTSDRSLAFLPWAHSFGQTAELHHMIAAGASIAINDKTEKILENLEVVKPTVIFSVPRIFNRIYTAVQGQIESRPKIVQKLVAESFRVHARVRDGQTPKLHERVVMALVDRLVASKVRARFGGRLKCAVSGGAALAPSVGEFIDALGIVVFEGYGLTETSPVVSVNRPGKRKMGTVGTAVPGVRVRVDEEGELIVYGPNVMTGYFKNPEETAAVFTEDHGFRTGDMAKIDADGFISITGRIKEQYKLENGKYVVPTPLEEQLKLSPYVLNAMVYGDNRPFNVALVVANVGAVQKWAGEQHLTLPADPEALLKDDRVVRLFRG